MTPPADLMKAIADDRAVAFLGSGLSLAAGLPDWPGLLKELAGQAHASGQVTDLERTQLIEWAGQSDFLMLADALVNKLGRGNFIRFMKSKFGGEPKPTDVHRELVRVPFAAYITTNYDTLLEEAWSEVHHKRLEVFTHEDQSELRDPFRNRRPFLVKVHGDIHGPDTLVLGLQDFRKVIHDNKAYTRFMEDVLSRFSIVFLGYSLSDPDVLNILDELVSVFDGVPGQHYALVDEERMTNLRAGVFLRNYGIQVIPYKKSAPNHPEVLEFVQALSAKAPKEKVKQLGTMPVMVSDDPATIPLYQALNPLFRLNLTPWQKMAAPVRAPRAPMPMRPAAAAVPPPRASGMPWDVFSAMRAPAAASPATADEQKPAYGATRDYFTSKLGADTWEKLHAWYESLGTTAHGQLLRVNLDRECLREDLERDLWNDLLQRLAAAGPTPEQPFEALTDLVQSSGSRYLLRGRRIETTEVLCRYMRLRHLLAMAKASSAQTASAIGSSAVKRVEAEDSNTLRIGEVLLGRPGGPSWCTTAIYGQSKSAGTLAGDLWDGAPAESIVEIRYGAETLTRDDYLRLATVPDIYSGRVEEANILKAAPGEGDWCWTIHVKDAPQWKLLAPCAVHPTLKLSGATSQSLQLRVVK
ncbi:SIR2 family NAD-dependent protein deacylase [Paludibaculum fermentans]|uniref:SIR2 family NAD-dependent protein deacylase n=1 Tax=Paludibaculum fermentans TaxID=1473598 RepID=UPI003EB92B17